MQSLAYDTNTCTYNSKSEILLSSYVVESHDPT